MTEEEKKKPSDSDEEEGAIEAEEPKRDASEIRIDKPATKTPGAKSKTNFPDPFYCPITKKLLKDPVVLPDGKSYEREEVLSRLKDRAAQEEVGLPEVKEASELYSNRALVEVIEDAKETTGTSLRANLMRMQKSMRQSLQQVLEKSAIPSGEYRPLPDSYYCPITFDLIHVPAIDPQGNTYEKAAIYKWIQANQDSPITRSPLQISDLYDNLAISDMLEELKGKSDGEIHPSIRKWKDSQAPELPDVESDPNNYPTTAEELEARRREHDHTECGPLSTIFLLALIVIAFFYFPLISICCCVTLCCLGIFADEDEDE